MASTSKDTQTANVGAPIASHSKYHDFENDHEPGACRESMLITTDSIEEFSNEMSSITVNASPEHAKQPEQPQLCAATSTNNILDEMTCSTTSSDNNRMSESGSFCSTNSNEAAEDDSEWNYMQAPDWLNKKRHVFILSTAGKPIYSLHGREDKLVTLFGFMQVLVSIVQSNNDTLYSIHANGIKFVFLIRTPLILVAVSRVKASVQQIQMHLTDVYNQILSTLTLDRITNIYESRKNFDFRPFLGGTERFMDHLLTDESYTSNNPFMFLTHSVRILPMSQSVRDSITSAIQNNCSKIKQLVFAMLIAKNKLITLVRMKNYYIHPADLRIIFNLIECSESFKTGENWIPICLPKFNPNGYLYTHISYLAEDCQACLLLMTVKKDDFFILSSAKTKITDKLRRSNCLEAINEAMKNKGINLKTIDIPEMRHFIYKCKSTAQLLCSEITIPYNSPEQFDRLRVLYYDIHNRIHSSSRPLSLIYEMREKEIILAWVTSGYELFATFEPTIDKNGVILLVSKLMKWIKKEENVLFILGAPHF